MRVENNGTRYFSFAEMLDVPTKKKDKQDKTEKQKKFLGTCKVCKQPLVFISGTNIIACQNPDCKGYKHTSTNKDGEEKSYYTPVFRVLNEKNTDYARYLFEED